MYSENELENLLVKYVNKKLDEESKQINVDSSLIEYEGFDSLFIVESTVYIEDLLGITLPDKLYELENYTSVRTMVDSISELLNNEKTL